MGTEAPTDTEELGRMLADLLNTLETAEDALGTLSFAGENLAERSREYGYGIDPDEASGTLEDVRSQATEAARAVREARERAGGLLRKG